jgi:hypothetical protein
VADSEKVTLMCPACGTMMEFSPEAIHAILLSLHINATCEATSELFSERL